MSEHLKPDYPLALLLWNDAFVANGDVAAEELSHRPVRFHTIGWVLRDDEQGVSIAAEWAPQQGTWRGVTFVPRAICVELRLLERKKKRKEETQ